MGALALALAIGGAQAQTTRSAQQIQINGHIQGNGVGAITGPVLNTVLNSLITGAGMVADQNTWSQPNTASQLWTFTNGLYLNMPSLAPSTATLSANAMGLYAYEVPTGTGCATSTAHSCRLNLVYVGADAIASPQGAAHTAFYSNYGGTTMTGNRAVVTVNGLQTATTGNGINSGASYGALSIGNAVTANDGGTSATIEPQTAGQNEVLNVVMKAGAGATNWNAWQGAEIDMVTASGASSYEKVGIQIVESPGGVGDAVAGSYFDGALAIANGPSAVGWKNGIVFGGFQGYWPLQSTATAIGCPYGCGALGSVLDFSGATISGNFLAGPGFTVDGSGNETALSVNSWPVGVYLATVVSPGTGAVPGDVITPTVPGATATSSAKLGVASTQVVSIAAGAAGAGCTNGTYSVTGTTGIASSFWTGTATITGGGTIASISLTTGGQYGRSGGNPTTAGDPLSGVTGCATMPKATLTMGVKFLTIDGRAQVGDYSKVPGGTATVTAYSSTGSESGLTFTLQFAPLAAGVKDQSQASGGGFAGDIWNTWLGYHACGSLSGLGVENTCLGELTGSAQTSGHFNTYVGNVAGWQVVSANGATSVGSDSMRNLTGTTETSCVGHYACAGPLTGSPAPTYGAAVGAYALQNIATGANYDVAFGYQAGMAAVTSANSVFLGPQVGASAASAVSHEIYLGTGSNCDAASSTEINGFHLCAASGSTNLIDANTASGSLSLTINGSFVAADPTNSLATAFSVVAGGNVTIGENLQNTVSIAGVISLAKHYGTIGSGGAALAVCGASNPSTAGQLAVVSDGAPTSGVCGVGYLPGAGTSTQLVFCDGASGWQYH